MTATETSIHDLIASEVDSTNGNLDPAEIAGRILSDLTGDEIKALAWQRVRSGVVSYVASLRPPTQSPSGNGSARWEQVREVADILDSWRVSFVDRPMKALLDCSPADLEDAAEWYERRAEGFALRAESYRKLARTIRRNGASTPADLPRQKVRMILDA